MPSTSGRRVVVPLTNRSGGTVNEGDVVVVGDGLNDSSFTTTTVANFSGRHLGIAQETIINLAVGRVLVRGYAAKVNSAASLSRDQYLYTSGVAKEATASAIRGAGAFGQVLSTGTDPAVLIWGQPETGAGAPSYLGSPWSSGTSFPGAPSLNERFTRTDRGLDYYWDGTRWLCTCLHMLSSGRPGSFGTTHDIARFPHPGFVDGWSIYSTRRLWSGWLGATNASNYWQGRLYAIEQTGNAEILIGGAPGIDTHPGNQVTTAAGDPVLIAPTYEGITMRWVLLGSPPTMNDPGCVIWFRFVG